MRADGYEVGHDEYQGTPLRLCEVTLVCNADDLRRIHSFVGDVIARADAPEGTWHEHPLDADALRTGDVTALIIWFEE